MKVWRPKTIGSAIATGLGLVSVIVGIVLGVRQLLPKPTTPRMSVVFVLDVSPAMQKRFGGTTKLAIAEQNIVNYVHSVPGVPTALRLAGGICGAGYEDPTIGFASNNAAHYQAFFSNLRAGARPDYVTSVAGAVNDFSSKKQIRDSPQKVLVLFLADTKECPNLLPGLSGAGIMTSVLGLGLSQNRVSFVRRNLTQLGFSRFELEDSGTKKQLRKAVSKTIAVSRQGTTGSSTRRSTTSTTTTPTTTPITTSTTTSTTPTTTLTTTPTTTPTSPGP